jgi:signal recognition particle subunit SEC65
MIFLVSKDMVSKNSSMKDMKEVTDKLGIKIYRGRSKRFLRLSQSTYIYNC